MTNRVALAILVLGFGGVCAFVVEPPCSMNDPSCQASDEGVELLQTRGLLNDEVQDMSAEEEQNDNTAPALLETEESQDATATSDDEEELEFILRLHNITHEDLRQALLKSGDPLIVALVEGSVEPEDLSDEELAHLGTCFADEETQTDDEDRWGRRRRRGGSYFSRLKAKAKAKVEAAKNRIKAAAAAAKAKAKAAAKKVAAAAVARLPAKLVSLAKKAGSAIKKGAKFVLNNPIGALKCAQCLKNGCVCFSWKQCPPCNYIMGKITSALAKAFPQAAAAYGEFKKYKSMVSKYTPMAGKFAALASGDPGALAAAIQDEAANQVKGRITNYANGKIDAAKAKAYALAAEKFPKLTAAKEKAFNIAARADDAQRAAEDAAAAAATAADIAAAR